MKRSLLALAVAIFLTGCRSGAPNNVVNPNVIDPFVGRTRVEPPRTGQIIGQPPADPYYPEQSRGAAPTSPAAQASTAPAATGTGWTAPSGGQSPSPSGTNRTPAFEANRSATGIPTPAVGAGAAARYPDSSASAARSQTWPGPSADAAQPSAIRAAATSSAVAVAGSPVSARGPAAGEGVIRIIEPRSAPAKTASWGATPAPVAAPAQEPARIDSQQSARARPISTASGAGGAVSAAGSTARPGESTDIMDLPQTRRSVPLGSTQRVEDSRVRLASATVEVPDQGGDASATALLASSNRYGHDPQYRWLRGKLEYSQIDRRWKLRYIPIDGATDEFGGSVVLSDATMLSGCERGDFVEIRGRLGQRPKDDHDYSPVYEVAEINRSAG